MAKYTILVEKDNKLFDRREYVIEVEHPGEATPKRDEVKEAIATMLNVPKENLILKKIESTFGLPKTIVYVRYYKDINVALQVENKHILRRNGLLKEQAQQQQ